ncbi:MAG: diguanylate cyclase, partial [Dethiobacteria bacterium]
MAQPERLFFATGLGRNTPVLQAIDRHLRAWKADADSPYFAAQARWLEGERPFLIPARVWTFLAGGGVLLGLALAASVLLKVQVSRRTRELEARNEHLKTVVAELNATRELALKQER